MKGECGGKKIVSVFIFVHLLGAQKKAQHEFFINERDDVEMPRQIIHEIQIFSLY